jgi:hypothetical protein
MTLPPVFPASFYRLLAQGALQLGVSRAQLATDAVRFYLKAQKAKRTPTAQVLPEELAEQFKEARRKLAQNWWSKLTKEERIARAQKANQARWNKSRKSRVTS